MKNKSKHYYDTERNKDPFNVEPLIAKRKEIDAEIEVMKAEKTEDIAQQRIAANREKEAMEAEMKSQKNYAEILKQVKDAEKKSEKE